MRSFVTAALALSFCTAVLPGPARAAAPGLADAGFAHPKTVQGARGSDRRARSAESRAWAGVWTGAGVDSRKLGFDIRVRIYADGSATIAYPSEPCDGLLLGDGVRRQARIYREKITEGVDTCLDAARVALRLDRAGKLHYRWSGIDHGARVTARGVLTRAP
jgi:hypothetical protein